MHRDATSSKRSQIVSDARKKVGSRYKYGGNGPSAYDCSGLVNDIYTDHQYRMPRTSTEISTVTAGIKLKDAKPGDLVFFKKNGRVFHVSIIVSIGDDELQVVHSTTSRGVIIEDIGKSPYWTKKMFKIISLNDLPHK